MPISRTDRHVWPFQYHTVVLAEKGVPTISTAGDHEQILAHPEHLIGTKRERESEVQQPAHERALTDRRRGALAFILMMLKAGARG